MNWHRIAFSGLLLSALAGAQTLNCDFQRYFVFEFELNLLINGVVFEKIIRRIKWTKVLSHKKLGECTC